MKQLSVNNHETVFVKQVVRRNNIFYKRDGVFHLLSLSGDMSRERAVELAIAQYGCKREEIVHVESYRKVYRRLRNEELFATEIPLCNVSVNNVKTIQSS